MTYLAPPNFRILPIAMALAVGACSWSTIASAQSAPATAEPRPSTDIGTMRLTDEEREAILDANTEDEAAAARGELTESEDFGRGVHGEVGVMIGSHGTRGIYGTADIPLGDNGGATISFESSRFGYRRSRPNPR